MAAAIEGERRRDVDPPILGASAEHEPDGALISRQMTCTKLDAYDWAWAIEAIAAEFARLEPDVRCAVAERLAARIGYLDADPVDARQRLLARLVARLADAALDAAA